MKKIVGLPTFAMVALSLSVCTELQAQGFYKPHSEISPKPDTDFPIEEGPFKNNVQSLSDWECPEWFRDVKFGIWAHWGPQCQAEYGDWYARGMYIPGDRAYNWHVSHYGDPSVYGFKEMCRDFTVPDWNPEALMKLYSEAGARYFVQLGNHHDNFDLWDSPYQEWNCMNMGPGRDIVGGWVDACRKYNMRYGISFHAAHCWDFMDYSQDFDGNWTVADGKGKWWDGYDPQELYAQQHGRDGNIHWYWDGPYKPEMPYMQKFQNRILQCVSKYSPDMIYFDDTVLPFWQYKPEIGTNILTHYYNHSANVNDGQQQVVVTGKILGDEHKRFMLWDVERGIPDRCQDQPWQTCTCIGNWHYDWFIFENNQYKSAGTVVRMLVDIVSKNGNLLLSIPMNRVGGIDWREEAILKDVAAWMKINSESIYGTRPWKVFGEGPLFDSVNPLNQQGFNEGINYSAEDVRYVTKDGKVFATIMRWPAAGEFTFETFSLVSTNYSGKPVGVKLLGYGNVPFTFDDRGLIVNIPSTHPNDIAPVFEITFDAAVTFEGLQELIGVVDGKLTAFAPTASNNTGKYSEYAIQTMSEKLADVKTLSSDASEAEVASAFETLRQAYADFLKNGKTPGGALEMNGTNLTTSLLIEPDHFSRSDGGSSRFGKPKYWTVENFTINNPNGTKNGIDNYPGQNTLMLGVWEGEDQGTSSDLTNARIYRKVHLEPGRYFFAATFNSTYQLNDQAYIFAATKLCQTEYLPEQSLAYYSIKGTPEQDGKYYGIEFAVDEEMDVYLGFQVNLNRGSRTQEVRVQGVRLFRRPDMTMETLNALINTVNTALGKIQGKVNDNTGFYNRKAVAKLQHYVELATLPEDATPSEISNTYYMLEAAYADYQKNAINPGGIPDETDATDLTIEKLKEADNFSRTDDTNTSTRFATPLNWTVDNFKIKKGANGTKNGIDNQDGTDALMLGVWDDRGTYKLTNSRIYQTVHLDAGRYFFGARFSTIHNLYLAYIFASSKTLTTGSIPKSSIAYYNINDCKTDDQFYGIFFTLEEAQDVCLGFQANLSDGEPQQEFRASAVRLLRWDEDVPDGIEAVSRPSTLDLRPSPSTIYDLQGRRLQQEPQHGIYIVRKDGKSVKVIR